MEDCLDFWIAELVLCISMANITWNVSAIRLDTPSVILAGSARVSIQKAIHEMNTVSIDCFPQKKHYVLFIICRRDITSEE